MPVYSEVLDDYILIQKISKKYRNILILGCGACMNESLAYTHNSPIFIKDNYGNQIPYSTLNELNRLTRMLNMNGYNARFELMTEKSNSLCMINYRDKIYEISTTKKLDAILVLSCPAGIFGIKKNIDSIPIIKATKQLGFLAYGYNDDEYGTRTMIKEKSTVIKYNH